jgi:pseudaminic acid biosynthesis-associated methylase
MTAASRTEQEEFWAETYARNYIQKNGTFDKALGVEGWRAMLRKAQRIETLLECGCNIGRIMFLGDVLPQVRKSTIEVSKPAYDFVTSRYSLESAFNGTILESDLPTGTFDLVFSMGVLIHINPDELVANMRKMYEYSRKYVLMGEYFNRTPISLEYQGQQNKLFKRDFGKLFLENCEARIVDYGFLWGHVYDAAGFDDITWWLFEKT